jgi:polysaccharide biosynthesis protein PslH
MKYFGKKILIVSPDFPYPPNHGGRVDIWGRIKVLHEMGFSIDLLATVKEPPRPHDIDIVYQFVNEIMLCKRKTGVHALMSLKPYQVTSRTPLSRVKLSRKYHFVLLETEYVAPILDNDSLLGERFILREHNDESSYFRGLAKSVGSGWKKMYYLSESVKFRFMSSGLQKRIKNLMFISYDEHARFIAEKRLERDTCNPIFLPPPSARQEFETLPLDTRRVLFLGSLFAPNNVYAIKWYIDHVHQKLRDIPEYKLVISGNTKGADPTFVKRIRTLCGKYNDIVFYENPENTDLIYSQCAVFVNPMHHGAGVKLKTINAIESGLPVVSTTVGKEGTGLDSAVHLHVADTADDFAKAVRELLVHPDKGRALVREAQLYLANNFDHSRILNTFLGNFSTTGESSK